MIRVLLLLAGVIAAAIAGDATPGVATPSDAMADRIVAALDRPLGLVHMPLGDVELAVALSSRSPGCILHLQIADAQAVHLARERAAQAGLLNRRIVIDQGDLKRLLPAGRSCDLVVLPPLAAAALTPALAAEVRRILHPWFGVAVLPDAPGAAAWAALVGGAVSRRDGLVLVAAPALAGSDDWSQWWHAADNNCVSSDTAFTLPGSIQWTGKPFFAPTRVELPIVSGGRLFTLWNGTVMDSSAGWPEFGAAHAGVGPMLMAQAVGSGVRLWLRRLSPAAWMQVSRAIVIGDGATVLVGDGHALLELDAASGRTLRTVEVDTPEIKWMAMQDGRLFVLGGSLTVSQGNRSEKNLVPFRSSGLNLMAFDRRTLAQLWRRDREPGADAYDPRSPSIAGERLFICGAGDTAEAISVLDGKTIWQAKAGFPRSPDMKFRSYEWDGTSRHPVSGYALGGVYVISGNEMQQAVVLAQSDGRRLWSTPPGHGQTIPLAIWGLLWFDAQTADPVSGKPLCKMRIGQLLVGREGDGRDFTLPDPVDPAAVPGVDHGMLQQLRLMFAPTTFSVEGLAPGGAYVVRLLMCEPWNTTPGRRLIDVSINGVAALSRFDLYAEAGGRNKAMQRDLPAQADGEGRLRMVISGTPGCADPASVLSGVMIRHGDEALATYAATGTYAPVAGFSPFNGDSCARSSIAPFLETTRYAPAEGLKSACGAGSFVADGLLWKFPSPCAGCYEWRGFLPQATREKDLPPPPDRLQRAEGPSLPAAQPAAPSQGWQCYRADPQRSSSSPAAVGKMLRPRWQIPGDQPAGSRSRGGTVLMEAEYVPTPPIVVGQRIIVARADGMVDAYDLRDGHRLWRAYTAGRIQSSPSAWKDRAFVGCADGQVYAFDAADGREAWRLRVAPEASRIMVYEQLGSRWPVLGSPLVVDDAVVASAGLVGMIDGVHVVCADAATGALRWERDDWSGSESGGRISGAAQFALGDAIFYHGGEAPPIRLDPASGVAKPAFPESAARLVDGTQELSFGVKGQDIGVLSNEWVFYGGRRLWTDQSEAGTWNFDLTLLGRDGQGHGRLPAIRVASCSCLPAWDAQDAAFMCDRGLGSAKNLAGIVMVPRDRLRTALEALMAGASTADILAQDRKTGGKVHPPVLRDLALASAGLASWSHEIPYGWQPVSWALCGNAVLVATMGDDKVSPGRLTILSRSDGSSMGEIHLPVRPVYNGLVVASDGSIVLTLADGQTMCIGAATG